MWIENDRFAHYVMNMHKRLPKHLHDMESKA
jgi:hypothetical protein